jgi:hypothetical protein
MSQPVNAMQSVTASTAIRQIRGFLSHPSTYKSPLQKPRCQMGQHWLLYRALCNPGSRSHVANAVTTRGTPAQQFTGKETRLTSNVLCVYFLARSQNFEKWLLDSSCQSDRPHGTTRFPLDGFSTNFIFEYSSITCRKNSSCIESDTINA